LRDHNHARPKSPSSFDCPVRRIAIDKDDLEDFCGHAFEHVTQVVRLIEGWDNDTDADTGKDGIGYDTDFGNGVMNRGDFDVPCCYGDAGSRWREELEVYGAGTRRRQLR
jgi:hypothetical protein